MMAMIRIAISPAAYAAIAATLPSNVGVEQNRAPNGDHYVWLEPRFVDRLRALRGPGESYSDVILRLATASSYSTKKPRACVRGGVASGGHAHCKLSLLHSALELWLPAVAHLHRIANCALRDVEKLGGFGLRSFNRQICRLIRAPIAAMCDVCQLCRNHRPLALVQMPPPQERGKEARSCAALPQPHARPFAVCEFDAGALEGGDELLDRIRSAADISIGALEARHGRIRDAGL
jgi:hypothetical protein